MRATGPAVSLIHALAEWGRHEAFYRFKDKYNLDPSDRLAAVEITLTERPQYCGRILIRDPAFTLPVEVSLMDLTNCVLSDGRNVEQWVVDTRDGGGESAEHLGKLISGERPIGGPLIFAAVLTSQSPPFQYGTPVLYEGWHRAGACIERARSNVQGVLPGFLIATVGPDPVLASSGMFV